MTEAAGHLGLDALADVLAGEHDDAHLRSCGPCRDRLAELVAADAPVRAALGALPAPPLPEGLAARLAAALEDEQRQEDRREQERGQQGAPVRPLRRRAPSWLPAVAASAVLVLAGAVGWSVLGLSGQGSQDAATSAAGGGSGTTEESRESGSTAADTAAPEAATGRALPRADTPTDWADEAARPAALARLLEQADASGTSAAAPPDDALARLRDPAALAQCVAALPGGSGDVLAVDYAQYAGVPAVAVVQPQGTGSVTVTVVAGSCSAEDPAVLSTALLPRP